MRVTNAVASRKRRKTMIERASGFRMRRSKLYRYAKDAVYHGLVYSFRDRKTKKRNYRALWQARINAAARLAGTTYSRFMEGLKAAQCSLGTHRQGDRGSSSMARSTRTRIGLTDPAAGPGPH